jgi:hypothetical protein
MNHCQLHKPSCDCTPQYFGFAKKKFGQDVKVSSIANIFQVFLKRSEHFEIFRKLISCFTSERVEEERILQVLRLGREH